MNLNFYFEFYLVAENLTRFIFVYLITDHFSIFLLTLGLFTDTLGLCGDLQASVQSSFLG